jgi:hypothetical protein
VVLSGSIVSYAILRGFYGAGDRGRVPAEPLIILVALYGAKVLLDGRRRAGTMRAPVDPGAR